MKIYGLTGGIAAGKSTVAELFQKYGIPTLDADALARELSSSGGKAHDLIFKRFGTTDREQLRQMVFSDPQARKDLEGILHPLILEESQRRFKTMHAPLALYEAALLVETGRYKDFDGLIVVEAPLEIRKKRLLKRQPIDEEMADKILGTQISDDERRRVATFILVNPSNDKSALEVEVKNLLSKL